MIGAGIFLAVALAAVQPAAAPPRDAQRSAFPNVARGSNLTIPSEVSPAVWPYYNCLLDSRGVQRRGLDGSVQTPVIAIGGDCAAHRREATDRADRLLRNRSLGNASRRAEFIETVLASVDNFVAEMGNFTPPAPPAALAGKSDDPLPSIDLPYQIIPAFQVYTSCVGERFMADPRASSSDDTAVRQANAGAVAACRDVREEQLARALELLTDYRPYGGDRTRARQAARTAFDRFDRDYLIETAGPAETASRQAIGVTRRPVMGARLEIPDELVPAIMPYMRCLDTSRGRVVRNEQGVIPPLPGVARGSDCRDFRARAQSEGERLLDRHRVRSAEERRSRVAAMLAQIDQFLESPRSGPPAPSQASSDAQDR